MGVAFFDIPVDIWNRMTPDQQLKANQAFLDGIIGKRLPILVVTNGSIKLNSTLQWEIEYLLGKGYTWNTRGDILLPPIK